MTKEKKQTTKAHKNTIKITLNYEKGQYSPSGIHIDSSCTIMDMIMAAMRLYNLANEKSKMGTGEDVLPSLVRAIDYYAKNMDMGNE